MSAEDKRAGAAEFDWYHTIDLGDSVVTEGVYDHRPLVPAYGLPDDLTGKSVLDVGPAHGFFAFELEARGADPVVTVDLPRWSAHDASPQMQARFEADGTDTVTGRYLHGALAFAIEARSSRVEQRFGNVYDLSPDTTGLFDLVFCGSMLLHVSDPVRALYAIRSVTRESAILVTAIHQDRFGRRPRAVFAGQAHNQVFWMPNMLALEAWCLAAGFGRCERGQTFTLRSRDGQFGDLHGVVRAWV